RLRKTLSLIFDKNYSFLSQDLVNVIVISSNDKIKLTKQELLNRALKLETEKHFAFSLSLLVNRMKPEENWDTNVQIFTDQNLESVQVDEQLSLKQFIENV
ncbi:unnamed protein product, partial [Didymodactylos carnosus]